MSYIVFIYSSVHEHLCCLHSLLTVQNAAINMVSLHGTTNQCFSLSVPSSLFKINFKKFNCRQKRVKMLSLQDSDFIFFR